MLAPVLGNDMHIATPKGYQAVRHQSWIPAFAGMTGTGRVPVIAGARLNADAFAGLVGQRCLGLATSYGATR